MSTLPFKIGPQKAYLGGRITDYRTGEVVGYVTRSPDGKAWRSRDAEGNATPKFTGKTRREAATKIYNYWAIKNNAQSAASFTTAETRRELWI